MSRDKRYQSLLNSRRWMETKRIVWQRAKGLCEECARQGYVRAGKDCHHIIPVESGKTIQEMERLCFDPNNIQLLCVPCHIATHKEMHKGTKANRAERTEQRLSRFMDSVRGGTPPADTTPGGMNFPEPPSDSQISLPSSTSRDELSGGVLFPRFDDTDPKLQGTTK